LNLDPTSISGNGALSRRIRIASRASGRMLLMGLLRTDQHVGTISRYSPRSTAGRLPTRSPVTVDNLGTRRLLVRPPRLVFLSLRCSFRRENEPLPRSNGGSHFDDGLVAYHSRALAPPPKRTIKSPPDSRHRRSFSWPTRSLEEMPSRCTHFSARLFFPQSRRVKSSVFPF